MYKHEDLLIIGDSFCLYRNSENHWPYILSNLLTSSTIKPRGEGFAGASWWSTRKLLFSECKTHSPKILILCHTNHSRIPNDDNLALNHSSAVNAKFLYNNLTPEAAASGYYFKYLYCDDFHLWSQKHWFYELDVFLNNNTNIEKVLHIYNFSVTPLYKFKKGITIADRLDNYYSIDTKDKIYFNHLSNEINKKLAFSLYKIINNYEDSYVYKNKLL